MKKFEGGDSDSPPNPLSFEGRRSRHDIFSEIIRDLDRKHLISWGKAHNSTIKRHNKNELVTALSNNTLAASLASGNRGSLTIKFQRLFANIYTRKERDSQWDTFLLRLYGLKYCGGCKSVLTKANFYKNAATQSGLQTFCKECHYNSTKWGQVYREAMRRAAKLNATPPWANLLAIHKFYDNRPGGSHVDHIVPLQGNDVCGLHILINLQYLTAFQNRSKGNKFIIWVRICAQIMNN